MELPAAPPTPPNAKSRDLRRMKWAATGLLIGMAALFIVARRYEDAHPAIGFLRAFAEAGMAGGIADWFAVTALFRHPLGLPLPHTAIIPRNKDRIGRNLGAFFEANFLSKEVVSAKLADIDLAGSFIRWIDRPAQTAQIADYLAELAPELLAKADSKDLENLARETLANHIGRVELAPIASSVLTQISKGIDYDKIITRLFEEQVQLLHLNKDAIRQRVRESTGWIWQRVSLDEKISDSLIRVMDEALAEVRDMPDHPWRGRFTEVAHGWIITLAESPAFLTQWEKLREDMLAHPAFSGWIRNVLAELTEMLRTDTRSPDSLVRARLRAIISQWAHDALQDRALQARLNERARYTLATTIAAQRHELAQLIADTVRRWDTATVTRKIEVEVGSDLQFVRINGTLIGGLVGLALHALTRFA
ncbi:DUF445 domain-containing protein [Cupriavidus sp. H39]|uniref:DUF445 domain-containing protein n=1 Tax=Cupriavidus sp. H39 TaxID=3401635 RepID=UPI003D051C0F